jgi:hypothetical protein
LFTDVRRGRRIFNVGVVLVHRGTEEEEEEDIQRRSSAVLSTHPACGHSFS